MSAARILALALAMFISSTSAQNTGYATYSGGSDGVCSGAASGLPAVSMNAAQFGGGAACGQCVQVQGTGNGAGSDPVSTAPYIAVVNNVCPQCAPGDIDLQESGSGKFGITWSFVACPGAGRKLSEGGRKLIASEKHSTTIRVSLAAGETTKDSTDVVIDSEKQQETYGPLSSSSEEAQYQDLQVQISTAEEQSSGVEETSTSVEDSKPLEEAQEVGVSRKLLL